MAALLGADPALNELVFLRARDARRRSAGSGTRELEAALAPLLANPDRRLRRPAVEAARDLGIALDGLVALVDDSEPSVRHAAIDACVRLGLARAAGPIGLHIDDEDPDVRVMSVSSLAKLDPAATAIAERAAAREECAWAKRRMEASLKLASK
jgi:HEAT repeat protein